MNFYSAKTTIIWAAIPFSRNISPFPIFKVIYIGDYFAVFFASVFPGIFNSSQYNKLTTTTVLVIIYAVALNQSFHKKQTYCPFSLTGSFKKRRGINTCEEKHRRIYAKSNMEKFVSDASSFLKNNNEFAA